MDEYEKLEDELRKCYEEYMLRFRSLTYLEQQVQYKIKIFIYMIGLSHLNATNKNACFALRSNFK